MIAARQFPPGICVLVAVASFCDFTRVVKFRIVGISCCANSERCSIFRAAKAPKSIRGPLKRRNSFAGVRNAGGPGGGWKSPLAREWPAVTAGARLSCPSIGGGNGWLERFVRRWIGVGEVYAEQRRMKRAVFIERDGILNEVRVGPKNPIQPLTLDEFKPRSAAVEPLQALKASGFVLVVTTNQPGLSRGYQSRRELDLMHTILRRLFPIDDILICPHEEGDHCPCRKPRPGLLVEAAFKWHLDLDHSFVVSDKWQDSEAARAAGCTSLLVQSPWNGQVHHDFVLPDLSAIVEKIHLLKEPATVPVA